MPDMLLLAHAVREYAINHYNDGGWDVIVECWENKEIEEFLLEHKAFTNQDAINAFKPLVSVWAERQADAINSVF